jgi:hypothetical protein
MTIDPIGMSAAMLARALTMGLFDKPPHFALSRVYSVIAKGVATTLLDPSSTVVTVTYTGKPCTVPPCTAGPTVGWSGVDPERYWPLVQTTALHFGPFSAGFFFGIGGIVDYLAPVVGMTDLLAPTGTGGIGVLGGGGVILNPTDCFDNIESEAASEDIMVVNLAHFGGNPLGSINDPTTGAPLMLGDLFVQAQILLNAIASQLAVELLFATKTGITTAGTINPLDLPIVAATITTTLF